MNAQGRTRQLARRVLWSLVLAAALPTFGQQGGNPLQLQQDAIAKIDQSLDYVRRTGDARSTASELALAQYELKASFEMFVQRQDYAGASLSTLRLGDIQRRQNQFRMAAVLYQATAEMAKRINRTDYETSALANLAYSELQLGEIDSAAEHAREGVRLGADCGNKNFYYLALVTAGEVETKRDNLAAAADYLQRAVSLSSELDDRRTIYLGYSDRGDVYYQAAVQCDYKRRFEVCLQSLASSRADYERAVALSQQLGYTFIAQTLQKIIIETVDPRKALIQRRQQDDETQAKMNFFNPQKPSDVLVTEYFTSSGSDPVTLALLENALQEVRDWQARLQQEGLYVQALNATDLCTDAQLAEMKGQGDAALAKFQQAHDMLEQDRRKLGDEQTRGTFMEDKLSCYHVPALMLLQRKRYAEAFAIFERSRSRAMADLLASRPLALGSNQERALYSQLQSLKTNIAVQQEKLYNLTGSQYRDQSTKQILELQGRVAPLQQQYEELEARITKEAPKLNELTAAQPVTLASVQRAAADGNYDVVYYVVMEHALILWHISGDQVEVKNVFLPHMQLINKTAALHDSLEAGSTAGARFDETMSRQLFLFFVQPVLASVKTRHLIVVPDEELNSIPFQTLQDPATGKYLGETFAISYAPSATVLATLGIQSTLKSGRLLAVADPAMHDARDEVIAIGKLYPGRSKVVTQEAATTAEVKSWVSDYNVVHLSVHGEFKSADPLLSYLQFKDAPPDSGRLTAAEMFGLPLQKNSLVVLSACETGRVEATHSNEVLGMVRSLLYAGAGRLVLSSWEVNAGSTRLWMETFYQQGQNSSPAEAARLALVAVKSHPEYSHPFFWAPFVMTGK